MKGSKEQPHSSESEWPLPSGSGSESRKRRGKRRTKLPKLPIIEQVPSDKTESVETDVPPNEIRLIWDRETVAGAAVELPAARKEPATKKPEKADKPRKQKKQAAQKAMKPEQPTKPQPVETTMPPAPKPEATPVKPPEAAPTSADVQKLLDELDTERQARAAEVTETLATERPAPAPKAESKTEIEPPDLPPPLPPEATSYRHFFWNEPSVTSPAEVKAEHAMLPTPESAPAQPQQSPEATPAPQPVLEAVPLHENREPDLPERAEQPHPITPEAPKPALQPTLEAADMPPVTTNLHETLGFADLMKLAKKIKIDGISLREVFIARRIDENGLRAVVQEYLRGGDVRKQLTAEIINREKSFERDPAERHKPADSQSAAVFSRARVKLVQKSQDFGKAMRPATREAGRILVAAAKQARHELETTDLAAQWPAIAAIAIIYLLIIILLLT